LLAELALFVSQKPFQDAKIASRNVLNANFFSEGDKKFTKHSAYESLQHYMASPLFKS